MNLRKLGKDEWATTYSDLSQTLHGDIFYMGEGVSPNLLRKFFIDAANYVEETTDAQGLAQETCDTLRGPRWSSERDI